MVFELADFIIKGIVSQPDAVAVSAGERNGKRVIHIYVAQRDIARVMGSRGLVIRAIRTILFSAPQEYEDVVIEAAPVVS